MFDLPEDWNDVAAWNRYFEDRISTESQPSDGLGICSPSGLDELASDLLANDIERIWVPGCGLSTLPHALAGQGFKVTATDTSAIAIEFQLAGRDVVPVATPTANIDFDLRCELHDSREPYDGQFDLIINVKAFQRFSTSDIGKVARVHFHALAGGQAIFSTLNCQGSERDVVEQSLVDAGFFVPFFEINRSYRKALSDTDIPYALMLGRPIIPQVDRNGDKVDQWHNESWRRQAKKRLNSIYDEHQTRMERVADQQSSMLQEKGTKFANVIYNTG